MEGKLFLIAGSARCGSNLLMDLLNSTNYIGRLDSHLNKHCPNGASIEYSDTEVLDCFKKIYKDSICNDYWGTKVDVAWVEFVKRYLAMAEMRLNDVPWIFVNRRNKIKQAISICRARRTGVWNLREHDPVEMHEQAFEDIDIPDDEIRRETSFNVVTEYVWRYFFERHEIEPHIVEYEDFMDRNSWKPLVVGILDFLEVNYSYVPKLVIDRIKQSADNSEIYRRFIEGYLP